MPRLKISISLNKLAKTGDIVSLQTPVVSLEARVSDRVPFGTGPAVSRLADLRQPTHMPIYHPDTFLYLKLILLIINRSAIEIQTIDQLMQQVIEENPIFSAIEVEKLKLIIGKMDLQSAIDHSFEHGKKVSTRIQHLQHWFDGFKTLRFIHEIRDVCLDNILFQHWLEQSNLYTLKNSTEMIALIKRIDSLSD